MPADTESGVSGPRILLAVWAVAFLLRVFHNQSLLADPLYYHPLGGNVPYLLLAERIAGGDLLPLDGAFTVNSPLYPYILGLLYRLFGVGSFYAVRLVGAAVDAGTCALVAQLALRHFGVVAAWGAGLAMAGFGPLIFFSTDLNPVPYTLFLLTAGLTLLGGKPAWGRFGAAGVLLGLAAATRPNLLLAGLMAPLVPFLRGIPGARRAASLVAVGVAVGLAPVPIANAMASGGFTLLTLSGGHNLYIGHNPAAQPQYSLPTTLDGDVFQTMRSLAEEVEGRAFEPDEVSGYYTRRAISNVVRHPVREMGLLARRALLLVNDFEATTYANYDYQRFYSWILRVAPTFSWLFALALPGALLLFHRRFAYLWIPVAVAAISILAFFYIARLRIVMVPFLGVFAGAAVARGWALAREKNWSALGGASLLVLAGWGVASIPLVQADTSNEWNKAGGVLRALQRHDEAALALERAREANPTNPNTFFNLAQLYRDLGREEDAARAFARGQELAGSGEEEGGAFRRALESG